LHALAAAFMTQDREYYVHCLIKLREERLDAQDYSNAFTEGHADYGTLTMPESLYLMMSSHLQFAVLQIVDPETMFSESQTLEELEAADECLKLLAEAAITTPSGPEAWLPLFNNTTHPIYTCQETELLFTAVAKFLKGSETTEVKKGTTICVDKIVELARIINDLAEQLSRRIKHRMSKSGWLDMILSLVQDTGIDDVEIQDVDGSRKFSVATSVTHVIGVDGLESWAARVLESWRDSAECMVEVCKQSLPIEMRGD